MNFESCVCVCMCVHASVCVCGGGALHLGMLLLVMNLAIINVYFLTALGHPDSIHRADIRLSDISNLLGADWVPLASELGISSSDVNLIKTEYPHNVNQQAVIMLQLWQHTAGNKATGKILLPLSVDVTVTHKFCKAISTQQTVMLYLFSCGHSVSSVFQSPRICA